MFRVIIFNVGFKPKWINSFNDHSLIIDVHVQFEETFISFIVESDVKHHNPTVFSIAGYSRLRRPAIIFFLPAFIFQSWSEN